MSRIVWHVVHKNLDDLWHLELQGRSIANFTNKADAMEEGRRRGHDHELIGELGQLIIHRADGSIQMEYSYGKDPSRTKR